jgi:hypothetical protein
MVGPKWIIWKESGRKRSSPDLKYYTGILLVALRKTTKHGTQHSRDPNRIRRNASTCLPPPQPKIPSLLIITLRYMTLITLAANMRLPENRFPLDLLLGWYGTYCESILLSARPVHYIRPDQDALTQSSILLKLCASFYNACFAARCHIIFANPIFVLVL